MHPHYMPHPGGWPGQLVPTTPQGTDKWVNMQLKGQIRFSEAPKRGPEESEADETTGTISQQLSPERTQTVVEVSNTDISGNTPINVFIGAGRGRGAFQQRNRG